MRIPFSDPGERHYMSIMTNEAQSLNIATIYLKIESIENLEKIAPFIKCTPFSQMTFFSNMFIAYTDQEWMLCFFDNFDPLCATGMTFKWLTFAKFDPILAKIKRNFKNLKNE